MNKEFEQRRLSCLSVLKCFREDRKINILQVGENDNIKKYFQDLLYARGNSKDTILYLDYNSAPHDKKDFYAKLEDGCTPDIIYINAADKTLFKTINITPVGLINSSLWEILNDLGILIVDSLSSKQQDNFLNSFLDFLNFEDIRFYSDQSEVGFFFLQKQV